MNAEFISIRHRRAYEYISNKFQPLRLLSGDGSDERSDRVRNTNGNVIHIIYIYIYTIFPNEKSFEIII